MGPDPGSLAALIAEARTPDGPVPVPLRPGVLIHVHPTWQWPWRAVEYLLAGRYQRWAVGALTDDSATTWARTDPTNRQVRAFLAGWGSRGGDSIDAIRRMAPVVTEHHHTLRGDLALHGVDLRDLWRPGGGRSRMTWRHLAALWDVLPGSCVTKTQLRDALGDERLAELAGEPPPGHGPWTHEALLLAGVIDAVRTLTWRFEQANFTDGKKIPAPEPLRRPGVAGRKRRKLTTQGLAYLQYLREHRGAAPPGTVSLGQVGGR